MVTNQGMEKGERKMGEKRQEDLVHKFMYLIDLMALNYCLQWFTGDGLN